MKALYINSSKLWMAIGVFIIATSLVSNAQQVKIDTVVQKNVIVKPAHADVVAKTLPPTNISEITGFQVNNIAPSETVAELKTDTLQDGSVITITISNPRNFLLMRPSDKSQLILYADGFPLKGMNTDYFTEIGRQYLADSSKSLPKEISIPFIFKRDSTTRDAWNELFKMAHWNKNRITFKMAIGWSGMFPLNTTTAKTVNTKVLVLFYNTWKFYFLCVLYAAFIAYFVYLCKKTGLIRDPDLTNSGNGPFSLAQTQLAFWTVIVVGGFIYLIVLTGLTDSLNDSILLLLGISGTTTGAASFIDYYKKTNLTKGLAAQPVPVKVVDPALPENSPTVQMIVKPLHPANTIKHHRNFILDILSDGVNVSVQRTQTVLWNLVLGLYFIWFVITNKAMPEFSNTLLVLAGVSSVLYVGSKGPENPSTKP
ncbi:hypothetical protein [Mucilaginibacter sp. FT3.2]|uniref:hypothetical protein n=1 Tax=Mucilaginibacter sp. FT3.2 TaxID=2723090 RepID=UPI001615BFD1|nr:hypothetical protein [Mucilaginibacter sp. FT3.2]MBB6231146.1 hypothetical protein [Mucilaginibacter sp. FT3.2]